MLPLALAPVLLSVVFIAQQQYIWLNMEMALEEEELITLTLSSEEVVWNKKGKELIVNGSMFDVRSIKPDGDGGYTVTGLYDKQEQELYSRMESLLNSKKQTSDIGLAFQKWCSFLYDDLLYHNNILSDFLRVMLPFKPGDSQHFPTPAFAVITPPPQAGLFQT